MLQHRMTKSGLISYRSESGYIFDEKGRIVAWVNPNRDNARADYEEQINELRAEIESIKQKQDKDELKTMGRADAADIDLQVNTKQVQSAAADVKKEIDKALKSLF